MTKNQGLILEKEFEKRLKHLRKAAATQITHFQNEKVVTNTKLLIGLIIQLSTTLIL